MKICFFGSYVKDSYGIPSGNGGILLKTILSNKNIEVVECHDELSSIKWFIPSYVKLFIKHISMKYDVMVIPWRGLLTLPLAKLIHKKPIIYFPGYSYYDTYVNDRKTIKKNSYKAKIIHFIDELACKWVDKVILESAEEIKYFVEEFGLPKEKFSQLPLAADESIFVPISFKKQSEKFIVLFFGSFIPLHGIETIVQAAKILHNKKDMLFRICGEGQTKPQIEKIIQENNLKNINLLGLIPKKNLLDEIKNSDLCLGIFGNTLKARKVVTNKVLQILASNKPLITMISPATEEIQLKNDTNCILIPPSDPKKLADAILDIKDNTEKRKKIAEAGYQTYLDYLSINQVGTKFVEIIQRVLR